jgi:2,4-dienoyl-CoA reductase-like NADH-dependent reductase (Old Yellow Enzyme family)
MAALFEPFVCKDLRLKNRIVMPPMCQFSVHAKDGKPNDWHFTHYMSRAVGGTGFIIIEMTDVEPDGRITDFDLGIWSDEHVAPLERIVRVCQQFGAKVGIQIGHAGRKAEDAPVPVSCSPIPYSEKYKTPRELSTEEAEGMVRKFRQAVERAVRAGVDAVELHGAHGYLIHQFHSPRTNRRTDKYGRDRFRFGEEIISAAREVMPEGMPLLMRISAVEYADDGYDLEYGVEMARRYQAAGVDLFHVSSGGEGPKGPPDPSPGYQVPFAEAVRKATGLPVIAVGVLKDPFLCDQIIREGKADLVAVGREMLRNPYWANEAAIALGNDPLTPKPYERAYTRKAFRA